MDIKLKFLLFWKTQFVTILTTDSDFWSIQKIQILTQLLFKFTYSRSFFKDNVVKHNNGVINLLKSYSISRENIVNLRFILLNVQWEVAELQSLRNSKICPTLIEIGLTNLPKYFESQTSHPPKYSKSTRSAKYLIVVIVMYNNKITISKKALSSGILHQLLLTKGTHPEKRRDYYLKKSPSNSILHQSHCKRML